MSEDAFLEAMSEHVDCEGVVTKAVLLAEVYSVDGPTFVVRPSVNLTAWDALGLLRAADTLYTNQTLETMYLALEDDASHDTETDDE